MTEISDAARIDQAEQLLGVSFKDHTVLLKALTHPSYASEHTGTYDYDRLEFLGDSVLGFVVADALYRLHPNDPEGDLTRMKIAAVSGRTLGELGCELGVGTLIRMGRGAAATGGQDQRSVLENCMEAMIGAVFIDQGLDVARALIQRLLGDRLTAASVPAADPKSALQEIVQVDGSLPPVYRILNIVGAPHERVFTAEVLVGERIMGTGTGVSKKEAQRAAALAAVQMLQSATDRD